MQRRVEQVIDSGVRSRVSHAALCVTLDEKIPLNKALKK